MKRTWSVRTYEEGDEHGIFALSRAVYQEPSDIEQWLKGWYWRHRDNPAGASKIWLAADGKKVVGLYVLNVVRIKIGNEIILGSQMTDLMTHPDYQRQGIFGTLAKQALDQAGKKGVDISYGFPNKPAHPGHLKSGYFDLCLLQTMIRPLNMKNILGKYIPNKFLAEICGTIGNFAVNLLYRTARAPEVDGLTISKIPSFDERIDEFWEKFSKDYEIAIVRDKEYLNWRYVDNPNGNYTIFLAEKEGEIYGYAVVSSRKQGELEFGYILELIAPLNQEKVLYCLISKAIDYFKEGKTDLILYQMIGNRRYRKTLRKGGFIFSNFISRRFPYIVRINSSRMPEVLLKNPENWFVQIGDTDWM